MVRMSEGGEDDPFCDLRAVNARRGCKGNVGGGVDWRLGKMICAGGQDVNELCILQSLSSIHIFVKEEDVPSLGQSSGDGGRADRVRRIVTSL